MIDEWRQPEPNLADDLRPHVQRRQRVLPFFENENGPIIVGHDVQKITRWNHLAQ